MLHVKHVLKESIVISMLIIALGVFVAGFGHRIALFEAKSDFLAAVYAKTLVALTNDAREERDLAVLAVNPTLTKAAQMKADDMAQKGYFAHYGPDGSAPWDWMEKAGYEFVYAGENLAVNFTDSKDVKKAWMASPPHRSNILHANYSEIGIATAAGTYKGEDAVFVVQMFGTPKPSNVASSYHQGASLGMVIDHGISNPKRLIFIAYMFMFALVAIGLVAAIFDQYRKHHIRRMILGIALLIVICSFAWMYWTELPHLLIA